MLFIDVARAEIRRHGNAVRITDGTLQLLVLLAVIQHPLRREVVADLLWPDLDTDRALNALKACIHRAREQLADRSAIVSSQRALSLSDRVASNYPDILRLATCSDPLTPVLRERLREEFRNLKQGLASDAASWMWFVPYRIRLEEAAKRIERRLLDGKSEPDK